MARYFFDTDDGQDFVQDETGIDLCTLNDVRGAASMALVGMLREKIFPSLASKFSVVVRDENGLVLDAHANFRFA